MRNGYSYKPAQSSSRGKSVLRFLLIFVFSAALLRFFLVESFTQKGISMLPSYGNGSGVLVNVLGQGLRIPPFRAVRILPLGRPGNGDTVLFYHPRRDPSSGLRILADYLTFGILTDSGRALLLRRVAGCPGDLVRVDKRGRLFRNGKIVTGSEKAPAVFEGKGSGIFFNGRAVFRMAGAAGFGKINCSVASEGDYRVIIAAKTNRLSAFPGAPGRSRAAFDAFALSFVRLNPEFSENMPVRPFYHRVPASSEKGGFLLYSTPEGDVRYRRGGGRPVHLVVVKNGFSWLRVPEGFYFVLGDNRVFGTDSRVWGLVAAGRIEGTVLFRIKK